MFRDWESNRPVFDSLDLIAAPSVIVFAIGPEQIERIQASEETKFKRVVDLRGTCSCETETSEQRTTYESQRAPQVGNRIAEEVLPNTFIVFFREEAKVHVTCKWDQATMTVPT